jgi:periplasmic protein CpxP/Spy
LHRSKGFFRHYRPTRVILSLTNNKKQMKKQFLIMLVAILGLSVATRAQGGGGFQRMSPEERVARIHSKLDSAFKLDAATFTALDTALVVLYRKQDAKMQELMAGGPGTIDRETMQAERKKYTDAQDEILKAVLNKDQYEIWKEKIQPSMRPQRPQGGGPGGPPAGGGGNN